jgi:hypothetical protein
MTPFESKFFNFYDSSPEGDFSEILAVGHGGELPEKIINEWALAEGDATKMLYQSDATEHCSQVLRENIRIYPPLKRVIEKLRMIDAGTYTPMLVHSDALLPDGERLVNVVFLTSPNEDWRISAWQSTLADYKHAGKTIKVLEDIVTWIDLVSGKSGITSSIWPAYPRT